MNKIARIKREFVLEKYAATKILKIGHPEPNIQVFDHPWDYTNTLVSDSPSSREWERWELPHRSSTV